MKWRGPLPEGRRVLMFLLLAASLSSTARAEAPPSLTLVAGPESCPSAAELGAAIHALIPEVEVRRAGAIVAASSTTMEQTVKLIDLGPRYRIEALGQTRELTDAARQCDERARAAALFLALVLYPPEVGERGASHLPPTAAATVIPVLDADEPPYSPDSPAPAPAVDRDAAPPSTKAAPAKASPAPGPLHLDLEIGGLFDAAAGEALAAGAVFLRGELGVTRHLGVALGGAYQSVYANLDNEPGGNGASRLRLQRAPFDLDLRGHLDLKHVVDLMVELGFDLTLLQASTVEQRMRMNFSRHYSEGEPGMRAALAARYHLSSRIAPFVAVQLVAERAGFFEVEGPGPARPAFDAPLPSVWLSAFTGFSVRVQ